MRHGAQFAIPYAVLERLLKLPVSIRVTGVISHPNDIMLRRFMVYIEGDSLPEWWEGGYPAIVEPGWSELGSPETGAFDFLEIEDKKELPLMAVQEEPEDEEEADAT